MADSTPLAQLKIIVAAESDISRFADNETLLKYALSFSEGEILKRRGADTLEDQYLTNQIEGAVYWLSRLGAEGIEAVNENGTKFVYEKVPGWLQSVYPRLGTVRSAGTK